MVYFKITLSDIHHTNSHSERIQIVLHSCSAKENGMFSGVLNGIFPLLEFLRWDRDSYIRFFVVLSRVT